MIFVTVGRPRLVIGVQALERMARFRQLTPADPEAGGVLLGRIVCGSDDIVVDDVTQPTRQDRATRFNFFRSKRSAQPAVDQAWSVSDGTRIYLGEWHTHPEDDPHPSARDIANWRSILQKARFEQRWLFFLIVGERQTNAWIGDREDRTIELMPALPSGPACDSGGPGLHSL